MASFLTRFWSGKAKYLIILLLSFLISGGVLLDTGRRADTSSKSAKVLNNTSAITHAYALRKKSLLYTSPSLTEAISGKSYLKYTWYRSHIAQIEVNGQSQLAYQVSDTNGKYTFWVLRSQLKSINSNSYNLKLTGANNRFYHKKIGFFGDSIPAGWDGFHYYLNNSYPDWMAKYLGTGNRIENFAVPHAKIVGNRFAYIGTTRVAQDLPVAIKAHKAEIRSLNMIFVHIGTNDYTNNSGSGHLQNVIRHLRHNILALKMLNPRAKFYGVLPLTRFGSDGQNRQNTMNTYGYTFGQLQNAEARLYHQLGITVIDFDLIAPDLITDQNKDTVYEDHKVHPTPQVAQKLGYYLAKFLINK